MDRTRQDSPNCGVPEVGAARRLSPQTATWLAERPHAEALVRSVWDRLAELEQASHQPGAIGALRRVLIDHQPTAAGRCRTCRRRTWRRRRFPCVVWHQIRGNLLGW